MGREPSTWRRWMKLDVLALMSSEDVFAMTGDEFKGYWMLVCNQFLAEDGYLPANEELLRKKSRLTKPQWQEAKEAILAKFDLVGTRYSNRRCREEWEYAYAQWEQRTEAGKTSAAKRKAAREASEEPATDGQRPLNDQSTEGERPYVVLCSVVSSPVLSSGFNALTPGLSQEKPSPEPQGAIAERSKVPGHGRNEPEKQESGRVENSPATALFSSNLPRQALVEPQDRVEPVENTAPKSSAVAPPCDPNPLNEGEVSQRVLEARQRAAAEKERTARADLGWPPDVDRVEALKDVLRCYPKPQVGDYIRKVAIDAVDRIALERVCGHWEALQWLRGRMIRYGELRKSHLHAVVTFLNDEIYAWDDEKYGEEKDEKQIGREYHEALLRKADEAGSDRGDGRRPDAGMGPQSSTPDVPALRVAAGGFGHRALVDRLH